MNRPVRSPIVAARRRSLLRLGAMAAALAGASGRAHAAFEVTRWPARRAAPPLKLEDLAGTTWSLPALRGRVVLLNFWASWCPPCREEFPSLERLHLALGGPDFTVVAIAVADTEAGVAAFLGGRRPPFAVLLDDDRKTAEAYRAAGVPVTYLVDREGRLVAGKAGPQDWDRREMHELIRMMIRAAPE